jgi:uncharacterized protein
MDRARLLSERDRVALAQKLLAYEAERGHQVVVHTTPSLEDLEIEDYSIAVAEQWKAGHKGLDNGVILTVAPKERKSRIEVGYGLEGVIPDAIANRIMDEVMVPEFKAGNFRTGIFLGVEHVLAAASGEPAPPRPRRGARDSRTSSGFGQLLWLLILLVVLGSRGGWIFLPFLLGGGRGGFGGGGFGGGGFGGGGFGGGGGGFGGGGASGSW